MKSTLFAAILSLAAALLALPVAAQLSVRDDMNRIVIVKKPATRVVTLAPFLTEALFEVGAGDLAVGVDEHSEYPPQAASVAKVKTGANFSMDKIAELKPDLVLAWREGLRPQDVDRIASYGAMVYVASARQLEDVSRLLTAVGILTGRPAARQVAAFEDKLAQLRRANASKLKLMAFVEIWNRPLTTVSGEHFLSEALEICHAENVFADRPGTAPKVTFEDVLLKDPFVIIGNGSASGPGEFRSNWRMRPTLSAVKYERLLYMTDDSITRPTPRTPDGIARLCADLDDVRAGRPQREAALPAMAPAMGSPVIRPSGFGAFVPSLANPVPTTGATRQAPATPAPGPTPAKEPPVPARDPTPQPESAPPASVSPSGRPKQFGL